MPSSWVTPITDRSAADILDRTSKAFFNIADWVRINGNTEVVRALVETALSLSITPHTLTEPTTTVFPSAEDINHLIDNIDMLREAACLPDSLIVPLKHDWLEGILSDAPDYLDVNDWENDLLVIWSLLPAAADYFVYCGVAACGQPRFWQNQFRMA